MAARLGDVLYLVGCGLSLLWVIAVGVVSWSVEIYGISDLAWLVLLWLGPAMLFWIGGIACLYVLKGDTEIDIFPALAPSRVAAKLRKVAEWLVGIAIIVAFAIGVRYVFPIDFVRELFHNRSVQFIYRIFQFLFGVAFCFPFMTVMPLWRLIWRWTALKWTEKLGLSVVWLMGGMSTSIFLFLYIGPNQRWVFPAVLMCSVASTWILEQWVRYNVGRRGLAAIEKALKERTR